MIRMCAVRAALITHNAHMRLSVVAPLLAAALGHSHPHSHSLPPHSHQPQPRARTAPARSRVPTSRHGLAHPDAPPTQCSPEAEVDRAAASLPFTAHPPRPNSMYRPFEHKSGAATLQLIRGARLAPRLSGAAICGGAGCNATRYLPIWFALPSLRAFEAVRRETGGAPCGKKPHDFAPVVPDRRETYRFFTEREYYAQYASSLYGITTPKAGLDALRHYQILAAGSIPFFVGWSNLTNAPLSMFAFPRALVRRANELPGLPSEAAVAAALRTRERLPEFDRAAFNMSAYCELRAALLRHTEERLTTATLGRYFLEQVEQVRAQRVGGARAQRAPLRALMVSAKLVSGDTWLSAFLYHGLVGALGGRLSSWLGRKEVMYDDFVYPHKFCCYGNGYSYARTLPAPPLYRRCGSRRVADAALRDQMARRLEAGYFNVLIVTGAGNSCCGVGRCYGADTPRILNDYLRRHPETVVATVDGSDLHGSCKAAGGGRRACTNCHATFEAELDRVDLHFMREVDAHAPPFGVGPRGLATRVRPPESSEALGL